MLDPVVGHLTVLLILTYHALFATVGLAHSWPYRAVSIATHLLCCVLLFTYARRRVGDVGALLATVPILFLGTGADTFITLHQAAPSGSLTAGLAALLALDKQQRRWDLFASAMLLLTVAGDTEGVILAGAILLEILLTRGGRSRAWVPLVPLALFTAWALHYHPTQQQSLAGISSLSDLRDRVRYVIDTAAGAVAGLAGVQLSSPSLSRQLPGARLIAHVLLLVVVAAVLVRVASRRVTPRVLTFVVTALAFWTILSIARGSTPSGYDNRYVFVGALLLVLLGVELMGGLKLSARKLVVLTLIVALCTSLNVVWLIVDGRFKGREGALVRAELGALEISRGHVPASFQPDSNIRLVDVRAGRYFAAVDKYRPSPADSPEELSAAPEALRLAADSVLVRALGVAVSPASGGRPLAGRPPIVESIGGGGLVQRSGACLELSSRTPLAAVDVRLPPTGTIIQTPRGSEVIIWVRRFGPFPPRPLAVVRSSSAWLRAPLAGSAAPWHARFVVVGRPTVCRL